MTSQDSIRSYASVVAGSPAKPIKKPISVSSSHSSIGQFSSGAEEEKMQLDPIREDSPHEHGAAPAVGDQVAGREDPDSTHTMQLRARKQVSYKNPGTDHYPPGSEDNVPDTIEIFFDVTDLWDGWNEEQAYLLKISEHYAIFTNHSTSSRCQRIRDCDNAVISGMLQHSIILSQLQKHLELLPYEVDHYYAPQSKEQFVRYAELVRWGALTV